MGAAASSSKPGASKRPTASSAGGGLSIRTFRAAAEARAAALAVSMAARTAPTSRRSVEAKP